MLSHFVPNSVFWNTKICSPYKNKIYKKKKKKSVLKGRNQRVFQGNLLLLENAMCIIQRKKSRNSICIIYEKNIRNIS